MAPSSASTAKASTKVAAKAVTALRGTVASALVRAAGAQRTILLERDVEGLAGRYDFVIYIWFVLTLIGVCVVLLFIGRTLRYFCCRRRLRIGALAPSAR